LHAAGSDGRLVRPKPEFEWMLELAHIDDHCVGNWRLTGTTDHRHIRCDTCAAEHDATPENRLTAIDENYAGIYLRRLAAEGAAWLSSDCD
jgi:hypothetical protein